MKETIIQYKKKKTKKNKEKKKKRKDNKLIGEKYSTPFDFYSFKIVYWI